MRVVLGIEYDGSEFCGYQKQPGLRTVQACLEKALAVIANHPVNSVCAGRTDTGVHATGQVVHFDTDSHRSLHSWQAGTNSKLPKDITVRWVKLVNDNDFSARFSAVTRRYNYVIYNSAVRPALFQSNVSWQYQPLNADLMHRAAQVFVGKKDFTSFRASQCQSKTPVRTIHNFTVTRYNDFIILDITANAFLHHMIRNIAGALITIGSGDQNIEWLENILQARDRSQGSKTAPPYGLYLVDIKYPEEFQLPRAVRLPMFYHGMVPDRVAGLVSEHTVA